MRSFGKAYSTHERIRKILRCLPRMWRPMVTAITKAKDLKSMNLEDLIGSLRAHEVVLQGDKPVKKVKTIALKASQQTSSPKDTKNRGSSWRRSWRWTGTNLQKNTKNDDKTKSNQKEVSKHQQQHQNWSWQKPSYLFWMQQNRTLQKWMSWH